MKLGILFGGRSGEHEVSLLSAASVIRTVNKMEAHPYEVVTIGITREGKWLLYDGEIENIEDGSWEGIAEKALEADPGTYGFTVLGSGDRGLKEIIDFALPVLHGPYGEDGTIQGLFEIIDIPYGGSGVTGASLATDKIMAKELFAKAGLPQTAYCAVMAEDLEHDESCDKVLDEIERNLKYPIFVKPANMGSSVGISKTKNRREMLDALCKAAAFDRRLIAEQGVSGRELETAVLGNHNPQAAAVGEVIPAAEFYDYTAKYLDGGKSDLCVPADIPEEKAEELRELALKAYKALDCAGFARVDFFLEKDTDKLFINEINNIPGFTKYSMFPRLWEAAGVPYLEQIERIIELGYERYYVKNHR